MALFIKNEAGAYAQLDVTETGEAAWFWTDPYARRELKSSFNLHAYNSESWELYEADDEFSLNHCDGILRQTIEQGWISPEGQFYGIKENYHMGFASHLQHSTIGQMELDGWIAVRPEKWRHLSLFDGHHLMRITPKQKRTLKRIGRDPENHRDPFSGMSYEGVFGDKDTIGMRRIQRITNKMLSGQFERISKAEAPEKIETELTALSNTQTPSLNC